MAKSKNEETKGTSMWKNLKKIVSFFSAGEIYPESNQGMIGNRLLFSRIEGVYVFFAFFLSVSLLLRVVLLVSNIAEIDLTILSVFKIFGTGLLFDIATCSYIAFPLLIILVFLPDKIVQRKVFRNILVLIYLFLIFITFFDTIAELLFWKEFDSRFNFIAIDYLIYTRELIGNAIESYPVPTIIFVIVFVSVFFVYFLKRYFLHSCDRPSNFFQRLRSSLVFILALCFSALFINISLAKVSGNRFENEITKNGIYSLAASFFYNSIDYKNFYLVEDKTKIFKRLNVLLKNGCSRYANEGTFNIRRTIKGKQSNSPKNIIVLVVESLSAYYIGVFGNKDGLTPNLNAISKQGILFRNIYATGTRTVRGLEAISLSVPPTPGRSIIKRPNNANMPTIGQIFRDKGYATKFIYGGFGYFDNMNAFFSNNGFQTVDRSNMAQDEITFTNIWGVCDEDLYNRVLRESDKSFRDKKPFFSLVMSTSNHRPYTYPQKIDIPSGSGRRGAVKYTDYAIGRFIQKARLRPWFKDTIFVITADHCAHSAGKVEVPVKKYHIPLIIYSPELVKPGVCLTLCSQIDIVPTVMKLLKIPYTSRFFGQDIFSLSKGRAFLGTYEKLGLFTEGILTLLEPGGKAVAYRVGRDKTQSLTEIKKRLLYDTIAYYQGASSLIHSNWHRGENIICQAIK